MFYDPFDNASVHAGASLGSKRGRLNHHEVTAYAGKRALSWGGLS